MTTNSNHPAIPAGDQDERAPIKLVHLAVAEDGGVRFLTGRKLPDGVQSCELYAMPGYGRAPAELFAAPAASAPGAVQDERQADVCPRCDGSGEITVASDSSPDAHDVAVCCDHCQGSGAAVDAAKFLAAALSGEKYRHMQLWAEYRNFHRSLCARFGYGHDEIHFRRDLVSLEEAIAAKLSTPAASDAQALLEHPLLRDVLGYVEDAGPADVWAAAQSWMNLRDATTTRAHATAAGDAQLLAALKQAHMALIGFMPQHRNTVIVNAIVAARQAIDAAIAAEQGEGGQHA